VVAIADSSLLYRSRDCIEGESAADGYPQNAPTGDRPSGVRVTIWRPRTERRDGEQVAVTRSLRNLVLLVLAGAFLWGVWSSHHPPAAGPRPPSGPAFRTAAVSRAHGGATARLVGIQTSRQEGFDRVEFTFDRAPPGWRVGYASTIRDAAGNPVALRGRALLAVAFRPAAAHRVGGDSSFGARSRTPGYGALRQVRLASDLEGRVQFGLGLDARSGFRVLEATAPSRIIVDVRAP
jgi:hypothetical protein